MEYTTTPCACGCGELIRARPTSQRQFTYKPGHKLRRTVIMVSCACGCGGTLPRYDARGREHLYLPSHWSRIQPNQRTAVPCEQCGAPVERAPWHLNAVKHSFCSQACAGQWASEYGIRKGANNGHFNTITAPCAGCGVAVSKPASLINRRNSRVYCETCIPLHVRKGRKGFYIGYPKEFSAKLRNQIRERDNHTCQECGMQSMDGRKLPVHHIDYNKHNNDPNNLITLCASCHGKTNWATDTWTRHFQERR